jgi:hypothetical protein
MGSQPPPLDNSISKPCTDSLPLKKTTYYHINMDSTIAGSMNAYSLFLLSKSELKEKVCELLFIMQ